MSSIPEDLQYTKDHEWLRILDGNVATIGITDHAQDSLGDITFVELPDTGSTLEAGETFGVVESVKAASDLFMPVKGEILEVNDNLLDAPEQVNESPYENGWMIKIRLDDYSSQGDLLSPEAYTDIVGNES
jgi:glycine cleavage system H protein